jgi:hypothetical protein
MRSLAATLDCLLRDYRELLHNFCELCFSVWGLPEGAAEYAASGECMFIGVLCVRKWSTNDASRLFVSPPVVTHIVNGKAKESLWWNRWGSQHFGFRCCV